MALSFVTRQDFFGNTALHMAVYYNREDVIDWICQLPTGKYCLEVPSGNGYTPLTLAVKLGKVQLFNDIILKHLSSLTWRYGKVCVYVFRV